MTRRSAHSAVVTNATARIYRVRFIRCRIVGAYSPDGTGQEDATRIGYMPGLPYLENGARAPDSTFLWTMDEAAVAACQSAPSCYHPPRFRAAVCPWRHAPCREVGENPTRTRRCIGPRSTSHRPIGNHCPRAGWEGDRTEVLSQKTGPKQGPTHRVPDNRFRPRASGRAGSGSQNPKRSRHAGFDQPVSRAADAFDADPCSRPLPVVNRLAARARVFFWPRETGHGRSVHDPPGKE